MPLEARRNISIKRQCLHMHHKTTMSVPKDQGLHSVRMGLHMVSHHSFIYLKRSPV